jgi:tetratricopeptide (TPR) repeat protein
MNIVQAKFSGLLCTAAVACLLSTGCARTPAEKESRFIARGKNLVQKHDYQRAVLEFRNAIKAMPKDAEPVYQLALVYTDMGDYRTAFALLKKAVDLNPKHVQAQLMIAKFQTGAPDKTVLDEAKQRVEDVLVTAPNNTDALNALATLDMRLGNKDEAEQDLQTAVSKAPEDLRSAVGLANFKLQQQKDTAGAESVLKTAFEKSPKSSDAALTLGMFYLKHGRTAEAEPLIHRALELNPKSPTALLVTAAFQVQHGQMEQADATYRQISMLSDPMYRSIHVAFLIREGKRDQAITELNQLVKQNPGDRNLRGMLVAAYVQSGRLPEAQRTLDEALKQNPKDVDALLQRSTFFLNAGQLNQTEADLRSVLAYNPQSADAHYGLAKVAALRGSTLVQRQELNEALRLNPQMLAARVDLSALLRARDPKEALQALNEAPAAQRQLPAYIVERNWVLMALKDNAELRRSLDTALANNRLPELLYQDALLRCSEKDFAGARLPLEEMLKQQPENMSAVDLLAKTYSAQGNTAKAFETVKAYAAQRPKSPLLLSLVGVWEANASHFAEARQAFSDAAAANPDYMPARLALADVDVSLGNVDEAKRTLQGVLAKQPSNTQAKVRLAGVDEKLGNKAAARDEFRAVVQAEPNNRAALEGLAYVLAQDHPDEALKYAQNALELAPEDPAAQDILGWVYYRKNLYDSALSYFKTAVAKQPTAEHEYHLALAYSKVGNQQLAQQNLKAALLLNPKLQMPEPLLR